MQPEDKEIGVQEQSIVLTVMVVGQKNVPLKGATVTAHPGSKAAKTDSRGQVTLALQGASKYDITVAIDGQSQTVPYYVTRDGSRLLEVNLAYLAQHTSTLEPTGSSSAILTHQHIAIGIGLIVVVAFLTLVWHRRGARLIRAIQDRFKR